MAAGLHRRFYKGAPRVLQGCFADLGFRVSLCLQVVIISLKFIPIIGSEPTLPTHGGWCRRGGFRGLRRTAQVFRHSQLMNAVLSLEQILSVLKRRPKPSTASGIPLPCRKTTRPGKRKTLQSVYTAWTGILAC